MSVITMPVVYHVCVCMPVSQLVSQRGHRDTQTRNPPQPSSHPPHQIDPTKVTAPTRGVAGHHDGVRDVVDDGPEAEKAQADLKHACQEGELQRRVQPHGLGVALQCDDCRGGVVVWCACIYDHM